MLAISINNKSIERNGLTIEAQGGVGRNAGDGLVSVAHAGGDGDATLTANPHANETDVPALDDLAFAEAEGKRLSLGVLIEDLAALVIQLSDVSHTKLVALLADSSGADGLVLDGDALDNPGGRGSLGLLLGGLFLGGLLGGFRLGGLLLGGLLLRSLLGRGFLGSLLGVLLAVSGALFDRLCKLDLFLGLGGFVGGSNGLSVIGLQLLQLLLGQLGLLRLS